MAGRPVVVVGVRDPGDADAALAFAFEEAERRGAILVAVHTWHVFAPELRVAGDPVMISAHPRHQLAEMIAPWRARYPAVQVVSEVVRGSPARVLADMSAHADLVVLGRHDTGGTGVATVPHRVLGHARGPVAVIPARD